MTKPFKIAKANGKEYTDAGFKDAIIFNTLLKNTGEQLGIFISNDNDFLELFHESRRSNLKICKDDKELRLILSQEFNVISADMIDGILKTDSYLMKRILSECRMDENAQIHQLEIVSCKTLEDDVNVEFVALVDGIKYFFDIKYNMDANELLEASNEFWEESEENVK